MASKKIDGKGINDRQALFVRYYLELLNGEKAAIKAGYSKKSARSTASEYLAKPNIQAAIRKVMDEALAEHKLTLKGRIIKGYMGIAFGKKVANSDRIKALDALAKYENLWTESGNTTINNYNINPALLSEGQ